jgi:hypothetical protein
MATVANTVSITTNLNTSPYYDDFDETKNFHRILFRPGLAVQARELTQIQSILQNQIDRFAENIFQEGSIVRGCLAKISKKIQYIKLRDNSSTGASVNTAAFLGKTITGSTNKVQAIVIDTSVGAEANTPNFKTLFVSYISGNTNGTSTIGNSEIITASGGLSANAIDSNSSGLSSKVTIESGIIFAKDHFIRVDKQELFLDKYSTIPSYRIGYEVEESIITEKNDSSLLDPASGSYNYAAPGSARLKLIATIKKYSFTENVSNNFIELVQIKNGEIVRLVKDTDYNFIRKEMARRTYDESGNYIVHGMTPSIREHLNTGDNYGVYSAPQTGNTEYLAVQIEAGAAFVQGYELKKLSSSRVTIPKGTDINRVNGGTILADYGNYVYVNNVVGKWDVNAQARVSLRSAFSNSIPTSNYSTTNLPGTELGTARVRAIEYYTGNPGTAAAVYKLYLSDIKITALNKSFSAVNSVGFNAGAATANSAIPQGKADIENANGLNANTTDPSFDYAVYNIPAKAIKTIRNTAGAVDTNFQFYKSFDVSIDVTGQVTVDTAIASENFSGSGVLSDSATRTNFYLVARGSANTSNLTGTVTITSGSVTVTGSGTTFTTQVSPGDNIATTGTNKFSVKSVENNTSLTLEKTAGSSTGGAYHKRFIAGQVIDLAGVGRDGNRSINVNSTTTALIDLNETMSTLNATVICKLTKTSGQEASKTINRSRLVELRAGTGGGYTGNTTGPWPLGLADGFKLVSVRQKSGTRFTTLTEGTDVTSHFKLDTGMLDNMYDHASLVKKSTSGLSIAANDRFLVTLDHFTHSTASGVGYLSVDSYPVNDTTAATDTTKMYTYEIPIFVSPVDGISYDLRNSIDTRPRITDTANSVTSLTNISTNPARSTVFIEPSGGLHFPVVASSYTIDYDYYLKRRDAIVLNQTGIFSAIQGSSSLFPITPKIPEDSMHVATVLVSQYPSLTQDNSRTVGRQDLSCRVEKIKNDRYTMRDIGALKERIDNLEYYTSLNLLEKDAKSLLISDSNGLDRFKNGILVDAFTGHNVGNVFDSDYKISIDSAEGTARPPYKMDNIEMFYNTANSSHIVRNNVTTGGVSRDQTIYISNSQVKFSNSSTLTSGASTATLRFQVDNKLYIENATGNFSATSTVTSGSATATIYSVDLTVPNDLITLPYSHEIFGKNPYATTTRNLAGAKFAFVGKIKLTPDNDVWVDTVNRPDVTISLDLNTDAWLNMPSAWATSWNSWNTVITGVSQTGTQNVSRGQRIVDGRIVEDFDIIITEAVTTQSTRVGSGNSVVDRTSTQTIGELVKDVNIQPFMRSRLINFVGTALKPNTKLYAFFDNVNISSYITPTNSLFENTGIEGSSFSTNSDGEVYGQFRIPNDSGLKFRTGTKPFRLTDNPTNSKSFGNVVTSADAFYTAEGLITGVQNTIVSTRYPEYQTTSLSESASGGFTQTTSGGSFTNDLGPAPSPPPPQDPAEPVLPTVTPTVSPTNVVDTVAPFPLEISPEIVFIDEGDRTTARDGDDGDGDGDDPIAQSFFTSLASSKIRGSGSFLTKIDLFFSTKDPDYPVIVELRALDALTSQISNVCIPFGRVILSPDQINISDDGSKPTVVYFPSPVYLLDQKGYAFVVIPGGVNPNTSVWVSKIGENDILTGSRVSKQPVSGDMFISTNDKTFGAVPEEDMKYTLYHANFDKSASGVVIFKNEDRDYLSIANVSSGFARAGEVIHGETILRGTFANTKTLSVANNTTFAQGVVSGATGTVTSFAAGQVRVKNVSLSSKFRGGEQVRIRTNNVTTGGIVGNSIGVIVSTVTPTGRMAYYDAITSSNVFLHLSNTSFTNSGPVPLTAGGFSNNRMFTSNMFFTGQIDGYSARILSLNSLKMDVMKFTKDYIQPSDTSVFFTGKFAKSTSVKDTSLIDINVNNNTEFPESRYILSRSVESNTSASSSGMNAARSAEIKVTIASMNRLASPALDTRRVSTTTIENLISSNTDIQSTEDYVKFGGDSKTRYITRKVTLADGQDAEDLLVYLTAYKPVSAGIFVYYKIIHREDSDTFLDARWIPMTQNTASTIISDTENTNDFKEFVYSVSNYPTNAQKITRNSIVVNLSGANNSTGVIEYRNTLGARFSGYKYLAIKIVMTNTVSVRPPRITDLRVICLQK